MDSRVLERDRNGREVLWECSDCGKPFRLGWGSRCNACINQERRHRELIEALAKTTGACPMTTPNPNAALAKRKPIIHSGFASAGGIRCGAKEKECVILLGDRVLKRNWSWHRENVTCKKCLQALDRLGEVKRRCDMPKEELAAPSGR